MIKRLNDCVVNLENEVEIETELKSELEKDWKLVLHDDDVHTIPDVIACITNVNHLFILILLKNIDIIIVFIFMFSML